MQIEINYALNFVLNFLYNKLPRRRVNLFGEELEKSLIDKFTDHWYPDKPFKGSAYRCLKITDGSDPVLQRAARESGNSVSDIIENLPSDLAIWIDPGEVSYRTGEKGSVKLLYTQKTRGSSSMGLSSSASSRNEEYGSETIGFCSFDNHFEVKVPNSSSLSSSSSSPPPFSHSSLCFPSYTPRHPPPTYTAGMFAQTKFGSTKLKSQSKKNNRMSPTQFSNYIKLRASQKTFVSSFKSKGSNFLCHSSTRGSETKFPEHSSNSLPIISFSPRFDEDEDTEIVEPDDYELFDTNHFESSRKSPSFYESSFDLTAVKSSLSDNESSNDIDTESFLQDIFNYGLNVTSDKYKGETMEGFDSEDVKNTRSFENSQLTPLFSRYNDYPNNYNTSAQALLAN